MTCTLLAARPAAPAPITTAELLAIDVAGVVVPVLHRQAVWEYQAGYRVGRLGSARRNPVRPIGYVGQARRAAWDAGREAGRQVRTIADALAHCRPGQAVPDVVIPPAYRERGGDYVRGFRRALAGTRGRLAPAAGTLRRQAYDAGRRAGATLRGAVLAELERVEGRPGYTITPAGQAQVRGAASLALQG